MDFANKYFPKLKKSFREPIIIVQFKSNFNYAMQVCQNIPEGDRKMVIEILKKNNYFTSAFSNNLIITTS